MSAGNEFGDFLKARRAALAPDDDGPRRRVPGLRREEVAARAGVSTDYYTRLEQGRHKRPSESVQLALAEALELDPTAARHLQDLARALALPQRARPPTAEQQRLKHSLTASLLADIPARAPGSATSSTGPSWTPRLARSTWTGRRSPHPWPAPCAWMPGATPTIPSWLSSWGSSPCAARSSAPGGRITG